MLSYVPALAESSTVAEFKYGILASDSSAHNNMLTLFHSYSHLSFEALERLLSYREALEKVLAPEASRSALSKIKHADMF